jgi:hypothetical protein
LNERAFVEPPVLEIRGNKHVVIAHTYHWNAHPSFGSSVHEFVFEGFIDALEYMNKLGFTIKE